MFYRTFLALLATTCVVSCVTPAGDEENAEGSSQDVTLRAKSEMRDGTLVVKTLIPANVEDCRRTASRRCADVDGDGLVDAWEDAVLDRLRPRMALHPEEPLLTDPDGRFGYVARIFRPAGASPDVVRVILVTGFSIDPGVKALGLTLTAHDGDSERVALELVLANGGREASVHRAYFAVHEHTLNDQSRLYGAESLDQLTFGKDVDEQPRWVVFPSKAKHPEFARPDVCNQTSVRGTGIFPEVCAKSEAESHPILPAILNAGEKDHPRATDLASVGFPGDEAWVDQKFCGGFRAHPRFGGCAESIVEKLIDDPFARESSR